MTDERVAATVVIPTLGRADMLRIGLAALSVQSLPSDAYEVIVSVDGPGRTKLGAHARQKPICDVSRRR
jgi:hypothetical protein